MTAFFASAPKVAALSGIHPRRTHGISPASRSQWQQIVVFVAIASMVLGSFAAIGQKNIKRLMAYSSIGHMGFALVGLAAGTAEGAQGVLIYISIYVAMTLGSFAVILTMKRNGQHVENISDFAGLSRTNPLLAFFFAMLLVLISRHSAARGLLCQMVRVCRRHQGRVVHARRGRCARQRRRRVLLSHHHQGDVFRRTARQTRSDARGIAARFWRSRVSSTSFSSSIRGRWSASPRPRRSLCSNGIILDDIFARSASRLSGLPARCFRSHIGSTNAEALVRARDGERGPAVGRDLRADRRTADDGIAGPGSAPRGNLASSILEVVDVLPAVGGDAGFCGRACARSRTAKEVSVEASLRATGSERDEVFAEMAQRCPGRATTSSPVSC